MASAFREAVLALFGGVDLLVTDAAHPVVKEGSVDVLARAVFDAAAHEARLHDRSGHIAAADYTTQVPVLEGATNVFLETESGRERLYRRDDDFVARGVRRRWSAEEIREILRDSPRRITPNVLLRPVVESTIFPTLAYVGGPGELAYFAQAAALFEAYGIEPPVVAPRYSATFVEPSIAKAMEALGLSLDDLSEPREALLERLARRELPSALSRTIEEAKQSVASSFEGMITAAAELDPTLAAALGSLRNQGLANVGRAERKVIRAVKRGAGRTQNRLDRVLDAVQPRGVAQDRVLNVLPFVARYGEHFVREVRRSIATTWPLPASR